MVVSQNSGKPSLLAVIELGGHPNFTPLYQRAGYEVVVERSARKALNRLKKLTPRIIVGEFNFDPNFRDRICNLDSLLSKAESLPDARVIVFFEKEFEHQLDRLRARFGDIEVLPFPIDEQKLAALIAT